MGRLVQERPRARPGPDVHLAEDKGEIMGREMVQGAGFSRRMGERTGVSPQQQDGVLSYFFRRRFLPPPYDRAYGASSGLFVMCERFSVVAELL